jgi:predicted site-specific integrase-resolvase
MIAHLPIVPLLDETQVAEILNIKVATLRRWRWSGDGPRFVKLGGAVRYQADEITSFINGGERVSTSQSAD